jgi:hypothetical protein
MAGHSKVRGHKDAQLREQQAPREQSHQPIEETTAVDPLAEILGDETGEAFEENEQAVVDRTSENASIADDLPPPFEASAEPIEDRTPIKATPPKSPAKRVTAGPCELHKTHLRTRIYKTVNRTRYCVCDDCGHFWKVVIPRNNVSAQEQKRE